MIGCSLYGFFEHLRKSCPKGFFFELKYMSRLIFNNIITAEAEIKKKVTRQCSRRTRSRWTTTKEKRVSEEAPQRTRARELLSLESEKTVVNDPKARRPHNGYLHRPS